MTALGKVHVHLFLLGMFMFLIVALFASRCELTGFKSFRVFLCTYNAGVVLTAVMLLIRGIVQVLALPLSSGMSSAISGIAGIGHILTGTGIILLLVSLKSWAKSAERAA